jgi:serine/threonine protein kinase
MDEYVRIEQVGAGTFGVVYKARPKAGGSLVAIKRYKFDHQFGGIPATILREASLLQSLRHQNIAHLIKVISETSTRTHRPYLALVMEFYPMTLEDYLGRPRPWLPQEAQDPNITPMNRSLAHHVGLDHVTTAKLFSQLCAGLAFAHSCHIAHRDLKPANILLTDDLQVKIADFGIARQMHYPFHVYTNRIMTLWYRSPEILLGEDAYDTSVDLWSLGCILAEMVVGSPVFMGHESVEILEQITKVLGPPIDTFPRVIELPKYGHYKFFLQSDPTWFNKFGPFAPLLQSLLKWDADQRCSAASCVTLLQGQKKPKQID